MEIKKRLLIESICRYKTRFPQEHLIAERFIKFITTDDNCFDRSNQLGHLTGSAWLVNTTGTHVLLTHHRKLDKWLQLGGHADGNPDLLETSIKEAYEESGLERVQAVTSDIFDLDIHTIPARNDEPEHEHFDVRYALKAGGDETYRISDESHDLRWVEITQIVDYTNEFSMLRMAEKWLSRKN